MRAFARRARTRLVGGLLVGPVPSQEVLRGKVKGAEGSDHLPQWAVLGEGEGGRAVLARGGGDLAVPRLMQLEIGEYHAPLHC